MTDAGWFGRRGTAQIAVLQRDSPYGITASTRTHIAAYKQWDDIEVLLRGATPEELVKIRERHEKYRLAQATEVIPEIP